MSEIFMDFSFLENLSIIKHFVGRESVENSMENTLS